MAENKGLSLAEISNSLNKFKETAGGKIDYLYELFTESDRFPIDITVDEDSPGLWPSHGIQLYSILPQMNISEDFCTNGTIIHFAANRYCFQFMYVINDITDESKINKLYFRSGSQDSNSWNEWELVNTSKNTFQSLAYKGYMRRKAKEVVVDIDPKVNYVEIVLSIGSYYSTDLKRELVRNVTSIDVVLDDLQQKVHSFSGNLLDIDEGDVIVYDNNSYIAIYDGAGGCFGSSIEPGEVVHFDNCLDVNDMTLFQVIKI
mgnify:CR=1 FL=1